MYELLHFGGKNEQASQHYYHRVNSHHNPWVFETPEDTTMLAFWKGMRYLIEGDRTTSWTVSGHAIIIHRAKKALVQIPPAKPVINGFLKAAMAFHTARPPVSEAFFDETKTKKKVIKPESQIRYRDPEQNAMNALPQTNRQTEDRRCGALADFHIVRENCRRIQRRHRCGVALACAQTPARGSLPVSARAPTSADATLLNATAL
ncbi:hypothetical protein EVAR_64933_1 [Eumeta japonica]|uniref:Uncharacterized protein n=1 Tax=Eumeta variegata TaxID=151549 RepID=A0A4C1ZFE2_EUMVA|nr:hypothetical protein EVAR_64933_1 [Eumeta japonica]